MGWCWNCENAVDLMKNLFLLRYHRKIRQEQFANKFCVLIRRGFAAILCVLQKVGTTSGHKIFAKCRRRNCSVMPHQLLADGLAQRVDRGVDTCINGHGEVLHLEGNVSVVAHHVANGEEFLTPLEVLAAADCNVVPYAASGLGNSLQIKSQALKRT